MPPISFLRRFTVVSWEEWFGAALTAVTGAPEGPRPTVTGEGGHLPSRYPVEDIALACVAAALTVADRGAVTLDRGHVAAAVRSEAGFSRGGRSAGMGFASLSRFWATTDGWVRTHANYAWHRDALLAGLGLSSTDVNAVAEAIADRPATDVERDVFAAGGIAAAVRPVHEWRQHPQGRAVGAEPLVGHERIGDAPPRPDRRLRVLDLTRVIAGPVCTRMLGALGADVLRVDPPHRPDMPAGDPGDTLLGKRSAIADLAAIDLEGLVAGADVVVTGYRPGALDRFGLDADSLAARDTGLVVVQLCAWGHTGPWAGWRGFDSVVQGPSGIAMGESTDGVVPSALPCQLLDHGTGYLAAAAALDGVRRQRTVGGSHIRRLSLARTAAWVTSAVPSPVAPGPRPEFQGAPWLVELASPGGTVTAVSPPGSVAGQPLRWPEPVTVYGGDLPAW